jgi:hypothetical protein
MTQLFEAGIWNSFSKKEKDHKLANNDKENNENEFYTKCILFIQWTYPLFNSYMGWKYTHMDLLFYITIMMTFAFIYSIYRIVTAEKGQIHSVQVPITGSDQYSSLVWKDEKLNNRFVVPNNLFFLLWFVASALPIYYQPNGPMLFVSFISLLVYSYIMYPYTYGSVWCNISVYLGPIILLFF